MAKGYELQGSTVALSAGTASASVALPAGPVRPIIEVVPYRIYNSGADAAHVRFGDSGVTAATSDFPIPPGWVEVVRVQPSITHMAAISGGVNTLKIFVTPIY